VTRVREYWNLFIAFLDDEIFHSRKTNWGPISKTTTSVVISLLVYLESV
jgi:hypothetical protein